MTADVSRPLVQRWSPMTSSSGPEAPDDFTAEERDAYEADYWRALREDEEKAYYEWCAQQHEDYYGGRG